MMSRSTSPTQNHHCLNTAMCWRRLTLTRSPAGVPDQAAGADSRSPNNRRVWHQDESGRVHTPFEPVVLAATLLMIPVIIIER